MSHGIKWAMVLPLLFLVLVMAGGVGYGEMNPPPVLINMESWAPYYRPFQAEIQLQTPIRWQNPTGSPHTVRHDGCAIQGPCLFNSGAVPPDGSYTISGLAPGRYPYHCELHPIMRGELIVGGPSLESTDEVMRLAQIKPLTK